MLKLALQNTCEILAVSFTTASALATAAFCAALLFAPDYVYDLIMTPAIFR